MQRHFGGPVDILVQGHSHVEGTKRFGATLVVNPGSATLPHNLEDRPGTVAILEISPAALFGGDHRSGALHRRLNIFPAAVYTGRKNSVTPSRRPETFAGMSIFEYDEPGRFGGRSQN